MKKQDHNFMTGIKARKRQEAIAKTIQTIKDLGKCIKVATCVRSNKDSPFLVSETQIFGSLANIIFR